MMPHEVFAHLESFKGFEKIVLRMGMGWMTAISISSDDLWIKYRYFELAQKMLE